MTVATILTVASSQVMPESTKSITDFENSTTFKIGDTEVIYTTFLTWLKFLNFQKKGGKFEKLLFD